MADGEPLAEEVDSNAQHEAYEDPALKGPLMLDPGAKSESANVFLERVDAMLSEEAAVRSRYESALSEGSEDNKPAAVAKAADVAEEAPAREADDDGPRLKIKNSMNFGSAWGGDMPGRI
jgi:hypothetical protein